MNEGFDGPFGLTDIVFYAIAYEDPAHLNWDVSKVNRRGVCIAAWGYQGMTVVDAFIPANSPHIEEAKQFLLDMTRLRCGA
jgi:hypothetical protein